MLYKRYHRNYISQFRKGTEFNYKAYRDVVEIEPYYVGGNICVTGNKYYLALVYHSGRINYNIKIEKDVI